MSPAYKTSENLLILRHLAQAGDSTVAELMQAIPLARPSMHKHLAGMREVGWAQSAINNHNTRVWRISPAAYPKLEGIRIYQLPPAPKYLRTSRAEKAQPTGELVPPRRVNVFDIPRMTHSLMTPPARPGALDFKKYPSRGPI